MLVCVCVALRSNLRKAISRYHVQLLIQFTIDGLFSKSQKTCACDFYWFSRLLCLSFIHCLSVCLTVCWLLHQFVWVYAHDYLQILFSCLSLSLFSTECFKFIHFILFLQKCPLEYSVYAKWRKRTRSQNLCGQYKSEHKHSLSKVSEQIE